MFERNRMLFLAAVFLAVCAGLVAARLGNDDPPPIEFVQNAGLEPGTPIKVHVIGAVFAPGVYELKAGERVVDAVMAAGGPADGAELGALNLARKLRDEDQILVPGASNKAGTTLEGPGGLVDINKAREDELDALPGIGEAYARRIVDSRAVDGTFDTVEELVERGVLPAATFENIRDLIVAGP